MIWLNYKVHKIERKGRKRKGQNNIIKVLHTSPNSLHFNSICTLFHLSSTTSTPKAPLWLNIPKVVNTLETITEKRVFANNLPQRWLRRANAMPWLHCLRHQLLVEHPNRLPLWHVTPSYVFKHQTQKASYMVALSLNQTLNKQISTRTKKLTCTSSFLGQRN